MANRPFKRPPPGGFKPRPFRPTPKPVPEGPPLIFGFHAVEAALQNPARVINKAFFTENAENKLKAAIGERVLDIERATPKSLDIRLGSDTVHQGALLEVEDLDEPSFAELARNTGGKPLVVLDQVTDPHNVGAILRSCAVFGAAGVVMTRRHSPPLGGVLAKAASGALELVPVVRVQNLARALDDLRRANFIVIGLDSEASEHLEQMAWPETVALVLGAEGKGLRELTKECCNQLAKVVTDGPIDSLNVSNAAAIALHCGAMARRGMLSG